MASGPEDLVVRLRKRAAAQEDPGCAAELREAADEIEHCRESRIEIRAKLRAIGIDLPEHASSAPSPPTFVIPRARPAARPVPDPDDLLKTLLDFLRRAIFVVFLYPVALTSLFAFFYGGWMLWRGDAESMNLLGSSFLVAIGLGGLAFAASSAVPASGRDADRERHHLARSGAMLTVGSLLFLSSIVMRFMMAQHDARALFSERLPSLIAFGCVLVSYEVGVISGVMGLFELMRLLWEWSSSGDVPDERRD
jgi:hypothetical protein